MSKELKCDKCGSEVFVVDDDRSKYEAKSIEVKVNEETEWRWATYFRCSKCDHPLEIPVFDFSPKTVTLTLHAKKD